MLSFLESTWTQRNPRQQQHLHPQKLHFAVILFVMNCYHFLPFSSSSEEPPLTRVGVSPKRNDVLMMMQIQLFRLLFHFRV